MSTVKGTLAMTRLGKKELSNDEHQQIARLMYLHMETHPARIGRLFGVGPKYVRQLWQAMMQWETASPEDALAELRKRAKQA
jgi:hypothetical protein